MEYLMTAVPESEVINMQIVYDKLVIDFS